MKCPLPEIMLPKASKRELRPNPFTTYRDPETGQWLVIRQMMEKAAIARKNC